MGARQYTQKEWRLLSWWLAMFHPNARIMMNVKVGPTHIYPGAFPGDPAQGATLRVRNRWLDAIFVEHSIVHLVEAKMEPDPGIFSQLIHYARKFRLDPQFAELQNLPLELDAVVYHDDPSVSIEAPFYGVRWNVYQPRLDTFPAANQGLPEIGNEKPPLSQAFPLRLESWGIKALFGS